MNEKKGKKEESYEFKTKEDKEKGIKVIILEDDTHIVLRGKKLHFGYPKDKFTEIFQKQIADEEKQHLWVEFSKVELEAILKGLETLGEKPEKEQED